MPWFALASCAAIASAPPQCGGQPGACPVVPVFARPLDGEVLWRGGNSVVAVELAADMAAGWGKAGWGKGAVVQHCLFAWEAKAGTLAREDVARLLRAGELASVACFAPGVRAGIIAAGAGGDRALGAFTMRRTVAAAAAAAAAAPAAAAPAVAADPTTGVVLSGAQRVRFHVVAAGAARHLDAVLPAAAVGDAYSGAVRLRLRSGAGGGAAAAAADDDDDDNSARLARFGAVARRLLRPPTAGAPVALRPSQHEQWAVAPVLGGGGAAAADAGRIVAAAARCDFTRAAKDSIDGQPAYQVDLWNLVSGVAAPTAAVLALLSAIAGTLLPRVLAALERVAGVGAAELSCTEAFVRRYSALGARARRGVAQHRDLSRVTVTCQLSPSAAGGGAAAAAAAAAAGRQSWSSALAGGLPFARVGGGRWAEAIAMEQGECLFHSGGMLHGALPVHGAGAPRYVAVFFFDTYSPEALPDG